MLYCTGCMDFYRGSVWDTSEDSFQGLLQDHHEDSHKKKQKSWKKSKTILEGILQNLSEESDSESWMNPSRNSYSISQKLLQNIQNSSKKSRTNF